MAMKCVDTKSQKIFKENVVKENQLRLQWFLQNEERLIEISKQKNKKKNAKIDLLNEEKQLEIFKLNDNKPLKKIEDPKLPDIDPNCLKDIMKPVDPHLKDIINEANSRNRLKYLDLRNKILPEDRYFFPEVTSWNYGWKMFYHSKEYPSKDKFGRVQIIKDTFYRKNGICRDPDHYQQTQKYSPTVCSLFI